MRHRRGRQQPQQAAGGGWGRDSNSIGFDSREGGRWHFPTIFCGAWGVTLFGLQLLWRYHGNPSNRAVCLQRLCQPYEQGKLKVA